MIKKLPTLASTALKLLKDARSRDELSQLRTRYLGRKGEVTLLLKELGKLDVKDRRSAGEAINKVKKSLASEIESLLENFDKKEKIALLTSDAVDVTLPERPDFLGRLHPATLVSEEIEDIFLGLGFDIAEGPEIETDYYNFEALNIPKDHPARDMQDTFYVEGDRLLRTHTSPVQVRVMENTSPPLRVIAPGTVYRRDSDLTHTPMFHQIEGFMVDRDVTFSDLKGVLTIFLHRLFGEGTPVRFRPSFFPFTEPSAEVDIECVICAAKSMECRVCKGTGWIEILGSGMIHPEVFKSVGFDSEKYSGFAFGLGIERIAMLKFGIDDLRLFFENDLRFLSQF
ncbi:MAG: phenylalanine--tRNA ligase subunit alpha [Thermodesulfobacteriota bacterium]